jgi:hypothetical protein
MLRRHSRFTPGLRNFASICFKRLLRWAVDRLVHGRTFPFHTLGSSRGNPHARCHNDPGQKQARSSRNHTPAAHFNGFSPIPTGRLLFHRR